MKSTEISALISLLKGAQQDLSPGYSRRMDSITTDIVGARNQIDVALALLGTALTDASKPEETVSTAINPAVWDGLSPKKDLPVVDEKGSPSLSAENRHRYIIGTDTPPQSQHTSARLYREGHSAGEYVLAASGSIEQMRALAKDLTGGAA